MIDHRVGDLAMLSFFFIFYLFFFFQMGTEAFSKGFHAASVTSACSSLFCHPLLSLVCVVLWCVCACATMCVDVYEQTDVCLCVSTEM